MNSPSRRFPIQTIHDPWNELPVQMNSISWTLIAPHEKQALRNHAGQNLEKLAERGGLSACEAVAILEDADYRTRWPNQIYSRKQMLAHEVEAINRLRELCLLSETVCQPNDKCDTTVTETSTPN